MVSVGLKSSAMNGCGSAHVRYRWNRRSDKTMQMDCSHSPQASRQYYTTSLNLESREKTKIGRPRNTWCRDLEADVNETGDIRRQLARLAQHRSAWRSHVGGVCHRRDDEGLIDRLIVLHACFRGWQLFSWAHWHMCLPWYLSMTLRSIRLTFIFICRG